MSLRSLTLVAALLLTSQAFADGLYQVQGFDPERGEYTGQAWIHDSRAQRVIRWTKYRYVPANDRNLSYEVEGVWSGSFKDHELQFSLSLSNVLTGYGTFEPSAQELQTPISVSSHFPDDPAIPKMELSFNVPGEGAYQETWERIGEGSSTPLWKNRRSVTDGTGDHTPWYYQVAVVAGLGKVADWYRAQPQAQAYKDRDEFRYQRQYFVSDKTDADFYAANPSVLRVTNKTLNPLSLAEALMRRNAYAPKLADKAEYFRDETLKNNLNAVGTLELASIDENGKKIGRTPDYDSALWTAVFGWSELMRYEVTKDPQALANFKRVLDAELTLIEITGDRHTFARAIAIASPDENLGEGWVQGTGKYSGLKWRTGANNDMVKGLFLTFILAHQVLSSQDTEFRPRIVSATRALLKTEPIHERSFNSGIAHGLVALWSDDAQERVDELQTFSNSVYNLETILGDITGLTGSAYIGGVADWSGIHLSMISSFCQIMLAKELENALRGTDDQYKATAVLKNGESQLLEMQKTYVEAHRDFVTIMTYAFSDRARNDSTIKSQAKDALWTLKELPAPRFVGSGHVELTKIANWSMSAWPRVPWHALSGPRKLKDNLNFNDFAQGAYSYPIFETLAWSSNYLWKESPFEVRFHSNPARTPYSTDYLMVYWASRLSGLVSAGE